MDENLHGILGCDAFHQGGGGGRWERPRVGASAGEARFFLLMLKTLSAAALLKKVTHTPCSL